jgi:histone acetyltransferase
MGCELNPRIHYIEFSHTLKKQKEVRLKFQKKIKTVLNRLIFKILKKLIQRKQIELNKAYPGLTCFKDGIKQIPIESIPGVSKY